MKKQLFLFLVLSALTLSGCTPSGSGFEKLDEWTNIWKEAQKTYFGYPVNEYSNTVFFKRPSAQTVYTYNLALGYDDHFGGELAHVVVMQHVTKEKIDGFIRALQEENKSNN